MTRVIVQGIACVVIFLEAGGGFVFADSSHIYQSSFNLSIPSLGQPESDYGKGWMDDAVLEIIDHLEIHDVDITVSLTHENLFDLQIVLQTPSGTNVVLNQAGNTAFIVRGKNGRLTAVGGSGNLTFDDDADISILKATTPFFSSFKPVGSLSILDNENAFGKWTLKICDAYYAGTGTLDGIKLTITASHPTPEPSSVILLTLAAMSLRICSKRHY